MNDRYSVPWHFMPLPELLSDEPGTYEIIDSREVRGLPTNGMVDQVNKIMFVPLEPAGRPVSRHECGHVMWTPPDMRVAPSLLAYVQAVEDGRINSGLREIAMGIDLEKAQLGQVVELGRRDLEHGDEGIVRWALRTVASCGTNAEQPLLELADGPVTLPLPLELPGESGEEQAARQLTEARALVLEVRRRLEHAREREGGPVGTEGCVRPIARWLRKRLSRLGLPTVEGQGTLICCLGGGPAAGGGTRRGRRAEGLLGGRFGGDAGGPGAGRLSVSEPPLPHACATRPRGRARGRRPTAEGAIMRDIARYAHDQRVFATRSRTRRGGGSVLIDVSGSMSLDASDIDRIIAGAPEATLVAIYSGRKSDGELRVVVRDGRRVGSEGLEPYGRANVVDLPALEWLAKQPTPRVIISDGGYTGIGDESSRSVRMDCAKVCRRAGIVRVAHAGDAVKALARRR